MIGALAIVLVWGSAPAPAEPCPSWSARDTVGCMRGYAAASQVGLTSGREGVGPAAGASAGLFGAHGRFGAGYGLRFGYGLAPRLREAPDFRQHHLAAGPELRLGLALPRVFAFVLARGGYSRQIVRGPGFRTSIVEPPSGGHGGHVGGGLGAWARVDRRLLVGGEVAVDAVQIAGRTWQLQAWIGLTLGAWL